MEGSFCNMKVLQNLFIIVTTYRKLITLLDLAVRAKDGNFYEKSRVESRLKQLQREKEIYEISKANL